MKFPLFLGLLFITFLSCKKETTVQLSSKSFTEKDLQICQKDPCSKITIDYIVVDGEEEISNNINSQIKKQIIEAIFLGEDDKPSAKTVEDAALQFIKAYRDHKNEFEYELEYEAEITLSKKSINDELLSIQFQNYLFTGGAHGYGSTYFKNFEIRTGNEIKVKDFFTDFDGFKIMAEKAFRKQHNIPENESINATGFWFDKDTFTLPETMGISKNELLFIYNPYDIASYADGIIQFKISKKEATPYLKKKFL